MKAIGQPWAWLLLAALLGPAAVPARCADGPRHAPAGACRVHVYLLNGLDPLCWGGLDHVADEVRGWGYCHVTYGQCYDARRFREDVAAVHAADPGARVVVVGFSAGATAAQWLAQWAEQDGHPVSLLVYLDGKYVRRRWPGCVPPPTAAVIAPGIHQAPELPWAETVRLDGGWHFAAPTHPATLNLLCRRLAEVAAGVPGDE
jgi:hypothetical protein